MGLGQGDRIVAYMPNLPETVIAMLATTAIGAIWSSAAPEFGAQTVIDRFGQIEPKLVFAVTGYRYGGKDFDRTADLDRILAALPSVEQVAPVTRQEVAEFLHHADEEWPLKDEALRRSFALAVGMRLILGPNYVELHLTRWPTAPVRVSTVRTVKN